MTRWHRLNFAEVLLELESDVDAGLSAAQVARRQQRHGPNELVDVGGRGRLLILWVNLVTDGLPGLALAVEPAERETMRRPPYPPDEHIMGRGMWRDIAWVGLLMGAVSLALGYLRWSEGNSDDAHWRTIIFTVLTLSQMGNALAVRSARDSVFRIGLLSNKALLGSVLLTFALQMSVVYLPPLQEVFKTTSLSIGELLACLALSTVVFWAIEAVKLIARVRKT